MRIKSATGIGYRDAMDYTLNKLQERYDLNRHDALRLFAETIIRNVVQDELIVTADFLIGDK